MKYKGKQGSSYLFECEGEGLTFSKRAFGLSYKKIWVNKDMRVDTEMGSVYYKDIQTAVSMMQILIDEGEV